MIERDPYISIERAMELSGLDRATIYRRIEDGVFAVKPSGESGANGRPRSEIRLLSLPKDAQIAYWQQELRPAGETEPTLNLAEVPQGCREQGLRRLPIVLEAIERIASERGRTMAIYRELAARTGEGRRTIERWVDRYREQGFPGLIPQWGKTKAQFLAIPDALQGIILDEHLRDTAGSRTALRRRLLTFCEHAGLPCPSMATLARFLETIPEPVRIAAQEGHQEYRAKGAPKIHRDYSDLAVGEMWVGDHRRMDVMVRESEDPKAKVLRPWLTAWMDLRSRVIVGWHCGLVADSQTIALALRDGMLRFGKPAQLYTDRGRDYRAKRWTGKKTSNRAEPSSSGDASPFTGDCRAVLALLKITVRLATAFTPWAKPIEPWFGHTFPDWERTLPGWTGRDAKERPEKLTREIKQGALLTLEQFRQALTERIEAYHDTEHSALKATPRSLWANVEKLIPAEREVDLILMKHRAVRVYQQGIKFLGRFYWHDALSDYIGKNLDIRYNPQDIGQLVVFANGTFLCEAQNDKACSMKQSERGHREAIRRQAVARKSLARYREDLAVALDPDKAEEMVANELNGRKIYVLKRTTPEPGGHVTRQLTDLASSAQALDAARAAQPDRPVRPAPPAGNRDRDELLRFLRRPPAGATRQADAERDRLLSEIIKR